jgi:hypothetical protein
VIDTTCPQRPSRDSARIIDCFSLATTATKGFQRHCSFVIADGLVNDGRLNTFFELREPLDAYEEGKQELFSGIPEGVPSRAHNQPLGRPDAAHDDDNLKCRATFLSSYQV